jgi:predicted aspartyl protease
VRPGILSYLGYDLESTGIRHDVVTAAGATNALRLPVQRVEALGISAAGLRVLCHQLPEALRVGGLLGLDFLRGRRLEVDFAAGTIDLH